MNTRPQYSVKLGRFKIPLANFFLVLFIVFSGVSEALATNDLLLSRGHVNVTYSQALVSKWSSKALSIDQIYEIKKALPEQRMFSSVVNSNLWTVNSKPTEFISLREVWTPDLPDSWMIKNYELAYLPTSAEYKMWAEKSAETYTYKKTIANPYKYSRDYHAVLRVIANKNKMVQIGAYNADTKQYEYTPRRPNVIFNLTGIDPRALKFVADNFDVLTKDLYEAATVYDSLLSKKGVVTEWEFLTVMVNEELMAQTKLLQLIITPKTSNDIFGVINAEKFKFRLPPLVPHLGFPDHKQYNYLLLPTVESFDRYAKGYGIVNIGTLLQKVSASILGKAMFIEMKPYATLPNAAKQKIKSAKAAGIDPTKLNQGEEWLTIRLREYEQKLDKN